MTTETQEADDTAVTETFWTAFQKRNDCHDLSGRRVSRMQKGIYIVNGQKVVRLG